MHIDPVFHRHMLVFKILNRERQFFMGPTYMARFHCYLGHGSHGEAIGIPFIYLVKNHL